MNTNLIVKRFFYLSCIFGMLFLMLTPPFQAPDEDSHFKKAYVIAKGNLFPDIEDGKEGFRLPEEMVAYIDEQNKKAGQLDEKFDYKEIYLKERLPAGYTSENFYNFSTVNTNPIAHIVQATGINFGKIVAHLIDVKDPSVLYFLYFARLFNLLFYIFIICISIKIAPILKSTFAVIGLMPMALFQAATVSYDTILIALAFLATAIIFKMSFGENPKKLSISYTIILGVIAYIFIAIKIVYLPLFLLLLFLPKQELKDFKQYIKKLAVMCGIIIFMYIVFKIPAFLNSSKIYMAGHDTLAAQQINFVIHHPFQYVEIFFSTIKETRQYLVASTIGTFGLIDTNLYCVFLVVYLLILPLIGISDISLQGLKIKTLDRVIVIISVLASIFGCYLAMYIFWTSSVKGYGVGANSITGVQGRYFIPMMPVAFLVFSNMFLITKEKIKQVMKAFVDNFQLLSVIMLIASSIVILLRFWC